MTFIVSFLIILPINQQSVDKNQSESLHVNGNLNHMYCVNVMALEESSSSQCQIAAVTVVVARGWMPEVKSAHGLSTLSTIVCTSVVSTGNGRLHSD